MPTKGKDGFYHSKVVPAPGVKPVYFRARTLREFNQRRQQIIQDYRTGRSGRNLSFVDLAQEWWDVVKVPRLKPSSVNSGYGVLRRYILSRFPSQQLARAIRYKDLQACLDQVSGMSANTITMVIGDLKGICAYGVASDAMDADYSTALLRPKAAKRAPRCALTKDQALRMRQAFSSDPDLVAVALQYYLGLRTGESLGLRWGDIDFRAKRAHIVQQYNRASRQIDTLKTDQSERYVDIPDELLSILLPLRGLPNFYVSGGKDQPMTEDAFSYRWFRMLVSLGYAHLSPLALRKQKEAEKKGKTFHPYFMHSYYDSDFTPHALRHNYATACFRAKMDPAFAMRLLGHSRYDTTLSVYTDIKNMLDSSVELDDHLPLVLQKVAQKLELRRSAF